jgi:hypothetical protein
MKKASVLITIAGILFSILMSGCAKAPDQELSAAKSILDSAHLAEADKYVAPEFAAAQDSLNAAMAEIEKQKSANALTRNYDRAKALLASATATAQDSRMKTQEAKQKIRKEVDTELTKATAMVAETKELLAKAPKGKEGKAALEAIKGEIATVETWISEAQTMRTNDNLIEAGGRANAGVEKLDSIKVELTTAIEKASSKGKKKK